MAFPKTDGELKQAGYKFVSKGKCKLGSCQAEIEWWETPKGRKQIPRRTAMTKEEELYAANSQFLQQNVQLRKRVEELERERQPMESCGHPLMFGIYDEKKALYVSCKICEQLQSARELAKKVRARG